MNKIMNKVRKNKFIVSIILIIASVCAAGAFSVRVKANTSKKYDVEMPIVETIYKVLTGTLPVNKAAANLMGREKKHETERDWLDLK